ncbi:MAG TPA: PIN domain nuclease [Sphingobacteriaceae bacterium]|nr:PIN domain nuclease [Sphingobacteriaceae bacterium]
MSYLLDSHTLIWAIMDPGKLSAKVRRILEDTDNRVLVSSVSFWEISLKYSLGKLDLQGIVPEQLPKIIIQIGFELIELLPDEAATYHQLEANWHRDPFDRMLIWQAIQNKMTIISKDSHVASYKSVGLKVIW